jgi:DNA uptake protein ComE-like DNA-binding protein
VFVCGFALAGCHSDTADRRERDERTREAVAKATERAKPELQHAAHEAREGAARAAEETHAALQGAKEGWDRSGNHPIVNINSATESELTSVPGIDHRQARTIIAGRPYRNTRELISKHILSDDEYAKARNQITAH